MMCAHFEAERCRSCSWMHVAYPEQILRKQNAAQALLAPLNPLRWLPPFQSERFAFRNKAKMVVSGTLQSPILGIVNHAGVAVDLSDCPLYPASMAKYFAVIKACVTRAKIPPYDVQTGLGELKFVLLSQDETSDTAMVRFVLRSRESLDRLRNDVTHLQTQCPTLRVVSANLQPEHKAVLEGDDEIILSQSSAMTMVIGQIVMNVPPRSFAQTNSLVAGAMYAQASDWLHNEDVKNVVDLYCGVGGFALNCSAPGRNVLGVEISGDAVRCASQTAAQLGQMNTTFICADAGKWLACHTGKTDWLVVNPPRRGLGESLCASINKANPRGLIYSSCNPESLLADLQRLQNLQIQEARVLDMFPNTGHYELMVLLKPNN
jgi:23S rRNA (uracil747-C5)-methyltransferase